jgi:hypothetical protein
LLSENILIKKKTKKLLIKTKEYEDKRSEEG